MTDAPRSLVESTREISTLVKLVVIGDMKAAVDACQRAEKAADRIVALEREVAALKRALEAHRTGDPIELADARAQVREQAAKVLELKTASEFEIDKAMDGEFESRKLALAVKLICGKIIVEKAAAIRAMPLEGGE